jgi:Ras family protein T1
MTFIDPAWSVENVIYVGYPSNPLSAFRETRKQRWIGRSNRQTDRQTDRNVFQCFVLGPKKAEKSVLLNSFIERYSESSF